MDAGCEWTSGKRTSKCRVVSWVRFVSKNPASEFLNRRCRGWNKMCRIEDIWLLKLYIIEISFKEYPKYVWFRVKSSCFSQVVSGGWKFWSFVGVYFNNFGRSSKYNSLETPTLRWKIVTVSKVQHADDPRFVRDEMHIQERNNTTLTTCTKMTEEVDRRHGMNGNSSSKGNSDDNSVNSSAPPNSATSAGGRLKFFKGN